MAEYRKIVPGFWTGATAAALRGQPLAQLVAAYLATGPATHAIGIYYLPVVSLAHDLGSPLEGATKALRAVCATGFAMFDPDASLVWVPGMPAVQIAPELRPGDNRIPWVRKELAKHKKHGFSRAFLEIYRDAFSLGILPWEGEAPSSPFKPLGTPLKPGAGAGAGEEIHVELHSTSPGSENANPKTPVADVRRVFDHWRGLLAHPRARLDAKRERRIRSALGLYGVATCLQAIEGCARSPYHLGENDSGTRYDDIELILRDAAHVERFVALAESPAPVSRSDGGARVLEMGPPKIPEGVLPRAELAQRVRAARLTLEPAPEPVAGERGT